jgi:zinc transport system permease protein
MELLGYLSHGFIQRALLAGSFIAISCSTLGVFLVLRRLSLIGDGLAHVTFGGVALGMLFGVFPLHVAIPVVMASSIAILKLVERARVFGDAAIGMVSSLGVAAGIVLASVAGGFNIDLFSYLFGNILAISSSEVITCLGLSLGVIAIVVLLFHELLSLTFDEESARASGIKTGRINMILVLLTAVTVVMAMKVVGIMLISSLLIVPPVTALQIARSFRGTMVTAAVISVLSVLVGVCLSVALDMPTGATIVILNFIFFIMSLAWRRLRSQAMS